METTIELPALRRAAELAPNTADAEARTIEVIWLGRDYLIQSLLFFLKNTTEQITS